MWHTAVKKTLALSLWNKCDFKCIRCQHYTHLYQLHILLAAANSHFGLQELIEALIREIKSLLTWSHFLKGTKCNSTVLISWSNLAGLGVWWFSALISACIWTHLQEEPVHQSWIPGWVFGYVHQPLAGLVQHFLGAQTTHVRFFRLPLFDARKLWGRSDVRLLTPIISSRALSTFSRAWFIRLDICLLNTFRQIEFLSGSVFGWCGNTEDRLEKVTGESLRDAGTK